MELPGLGISMIGLSVGFDLLVGIPLGFFGMGGSFLVTPALLVVGYPAPAAVGSAVLVSVRAQRVSKTKPASRDTSQ